MPKSCAAYNCTHRYRKGSGISFHRFPFSDKEKLHKWILAVCRKDFVPTIHSFICSEHFTPDCFYEKHPTRILKENAVPTIFSFPQRLKKKPRQRKSPLEYNVGHPIQERATTSENPKERNFNNQPIDHTYYVTESQRKLKRECGEILNKQNEDLHQLKEELEICKKKLKVSQKTKKTKPMTAVIHYLKKGNLVNSKIPET